VILREQESTWSRLGRRKVEVDCSSHEKAKLGGAARERVKERDVPGLGRGGGKE